MNEHRDARDKVWTYRSEWREQCLGRVVGERVLKKFQTVAMSGEENDTQEAS